MARIAVMGAGSWGTAVGKVLADAGSEVVMWARREEAADDINTNHCNGKYLPGVVLPSAVSASTDPAQVLDGAEEVVLAVPSQTLRANLENWVDLLATNVGVISLAKGIETGTLMRISEVVAEVADLPEGQIAVLSGPNLAREVAEGQPAATVIACTDAARAARLQDAFSTRYFRPYTNNDVVGCEIGGATKNVIALVCGIASGMGLGDNTAATLVTRGLAESTRLGVALGASQMTFAGLAGLGDLVATCTSPLSRNRTFGERLGRGETLEQAQEATNGQVAEGVKSCTSIVELSHRAGVEMPLTEAVHEICHEGGNAVEVAVRLMRRSTKPE
ncbi:NAD(P)-dependent glycerol-3-phosphate dehydrogenase [Dietzia aurantiaca]|uniref:NAD(P)H-dependent glycerol-3-phosphate dehydrogenase n=1 Tax=Dietzia aurantiaca TaxID=983873 RepID=UPI001E4FAB7B|nr:NAD(P)H-dependent glycerol-3-phosphate dehydrogenase [Dietzia aurantiaca]MCD2261631.1 NAD(P)-dependent glycerol-3-phosphate dehydrogenase [Dietzia aurantiaca]